MSLNSNSVAYCYSKSSDQGMRRYMEDIAVIECEDLPIKTSFFAIYDGHGGKEAAQFARRHLWENIQKSNGFQSSNSSEVKSAIKEAFLTTHKSMQNDIENWPTRKSGVQSTAGTTVTCAILRGRKLFVAQLGDSRALIGRKNETGKIEGEFLTVEHKPEDPSEQSRIRSVGGSVASSNGTCRVVWQRKKNTENLEYQFIPFLAVSRSLGDLWSLSPTTQQYVVSPEPEITEHELVQGKDVFIALASDGLWGMLNENEAVKIIKPELDRDQGDGESASKNLVKKALDKWRKKKLRADNISVIVVFLDKDGPNSDEESIDTTDVVDDEENGEDTPTDQKVEIKEHTRNLVRQNAASTQYLESLSRDLNFGVFNTTVINQEENDNIESNESSKDIQFFEEEATRNLKRKSSTESDDISNCKRNRTISAGDLHEYNILKTNVSSKSIEALNLDKE